jgi:hypothetical protein
MINKYKKARNVQFDVQVTTVYFMLKSKRNIRPSIFQWWSLNYNQFWTISTWKFCFLPWWFILGRSSLSFNPARCQIIIGLLQDRDGTAGTCLIIIIKMSFPVAWFSFFQWLFLNCLFIYFVGMCQHGNTVHKGPKTQKEPFQYN